MAPEKQSEQFHPDFLEFWAITDKRGSKQAAYTAWQRRISQNTKADIRNAWDQYTFEKAGSKYMLHISTFLNSHFEGYLHRFHQTSNSKYAKYREQLLQEKRGAKK